MSHHSGRGKKKGFGFGGFSLTSSFLPQSWGAGIMAEREKGQGMEHNKTQKRERVTIVRKYSSRYPAYAYNFLLDKNFAKPSYL